MSLLRVDNLEVAYGAINALKGVSLEVHQGEIVALIGANGAGKTTLMTAVAGVIKARHGTIMFEDKPIQNKVPEEIVRLGIALVPEGRRIFPTLSVKENLRLGAMIRRDKRIAEDIEAMCTRFAILGKRLTQPAGTLSGGEQQQLAIARALMSRPKLLLLDEPSLGLAPLLVDEIFALIDQLREMDVTIVIVEQNAERTLKLADRAYVMQTGHIIAESEVDTLSGRPDIDIRTAYLGSASHG